MTHKIVDIDLDNLTRVDCDNVLETLKKELVVVIKNQPTDSYKFARLIHGMNNTISNFGQCVWNENGEYVADQWKTYIDPWDCNVYPVQRVTAEKKNGDYSGIFPRGKLDWHANLNGPDRADGVALQGIRGVEGTVTSWLNTAVAYEQMPEQLKEKISGVRCSYTYNMENWADIDNVDQLEFMRKNRHDYSMFIEQENIAGTKGLYFYDNNDLRIIEKDVELYFELKEYLFQEKFMYHHDWEVGDIVLSDQLLTLHRRPVRSDEVFENRLLHRYTFPISNVGKVKFIEERNVVSR